MSLVAVYPSNAAQPVELSPKDPGAEIPYSFDWTDWLAGETIVSSSWSLSSADITNAGDTIDGSNQVTTIVISGGSAGKTYLATNTITTATRTEKRTFKIRCRER